MFALFDFIDEVPCRFEKPSVDVRESREIGEGERIAFVLPLRVGECVIRSVQARDLLRWVELAVNP